MANKVYSYTFRGNFTNLTAGLTATSRSVGELGTRLTALDRKGAVARRGLTTLGTTAGTAGLAAAAGLGAIVLATAKFDKQMSAVAATGADAKSSLDDLRAAAIKAGAETAFSATEAAQGVENLLKAGISAKDTLSGGLTGALSLAAAGELEVADAAEIAATAMTQFNLKGSDVTHVADLLAAGAGKAQGDVYDLGMALKQSGLVASQMGVSLEETTGVLSAFASAGLLGSDAGTSLKTMLLRLANPSKEAAATMTEFGISAYDAQGNLVSMSELAGQLSTAFAGQTQATRDAALATIFGSDAIRAATVLYDQGAAGISKWTANVDDAGYAAEAAKTRLDNLAGDFEAFKGSLETALIGTGEGSTGVFRELLQGATGAINLFNKLPAPIKTVSSALLAVTAITGGSLWFGSKVISGITDTKSALQDLGITAKLSKVSMGSLAGATSLAGVAVGAGLAVLLSWSQAQREAAAAADALSETLDEQTGAMTDLSRQTLVDSLRSAGLVDWANENGVALADMVSAIEAGGDAYAELQAQVQGSSVAGGQFQIEALLAGLGNVRSAVVDGKQVWIENKEVIDGSAAATDGLTGATLGATKAQHDETQALIDAVDAMREKRNATLGAFDAETQYRQALKDAVEQGKKNNAGIRGNSKAALENRATISSLAAAWNNQSDAVKNNQGRFKAARGAFIETATAMGVPLEAARKLAKQLLEIPESRVTKVTANTQVAQSKLAALQSQIRNLRDKTITINTLTKQSASAGGVADGGTIGGPRAPYGDKMLYLLAPGEEVISNRHGQADRNRPLLKAINANRAADGTTAGGSGYSYTGGSNALGGLGKAAEESRKALLEEAKTRRDNLREQKRTMASSVASSFRSDIFATGSDVWSASASADPLAALQRDTQNARQFRTAITSLKSRGFGGAALQDVVGRGDLGIAQDLAGKSRSYLARLETAYNTRQRVTAGVGASTADAVLGGELREANRRLDRLTAEVRALRKDGPRNAKATGDHVGDKINRAAGAGRRDGHRGATT